MPRRESGLVTTPANCTAMESTGYNKRGLTYHVCKGLI